MANATTRPTRAAGPSDDRGDTTHGNEPVQARRPSADARMQVRAADLEPYIGLKYLSRLFKLMAAVLIVLLVAEVITGLVEQGVDALVPLLREVSRLVVLAGLLWGVGDLAILLIDMGHDLRATRILIGRQLAHHMDEQHSTVDPALASPSLDTLEAVEPMPPV